MSINGGASKEMIEHAGNVIEFGRKDVFQFVTFSIKCLIFQYIFGHLIYTR